MDRKATIKTPAQFAERIKILSKLARRLAHEFRFLTGALFALEKAEKLKHKARASYAESDCQHHIDDLEEVLTAIAEGKEEPPKQWLAGFYYNSGIMRIVAVYERLKKAVPDLSDSAPSLQLLDEDVNKLKHRLDGITAKEKCGKPDDLLIAWTALDELLKFIETPKIQDYLEKKYSSLPKP